MSVSGKFLTATVGSANVNGTHEWSAQETADRQEATTGADRGRGRKDGGVIDTKVSVTFYLDIATGQFTFVRTGTILTDVKLFADIDSATPLYELGTAEVFDFQIRGQVRGQMIATCELEAKGDVVTALNANGNP